jgi:hypothetical protein
MMRGVSIFKSGSRMNGRWKTGNLWGYGGKLETQNNLDGNGICIIMRHKRVHGKI